MVTRTPLCLHNRQSGSTFCNLTFRYCVSIIRSVTPQTCIAKHAFCDTKYMLRFFIPYVYVNSFVVDYERKVKIKFNVYSESEVL